MLSPSGDGGRHDGERVPVSPEELQLANLESRIGGKRPDAGGTDLINRAINRLRLLMAATAPVPQSPPVLH